MPRACVVVGAGFSYVAGLPLAADLLSASALALSSGARRRFAAVWDDFDQRRALRPSMAPEEYLQELWAGEQAGKATLFRRAVELVGAVLATPRPGARNAGNPRYVVRVDQPTDCRPHVDFLRCVHAADGAFSVVTTNYDILVERALRHRPMRRGFGPGCHYGGLGGQQFLTGCSPWQRRQGYVALCGPIPVCKLHGSLNWASDGELYADMRPVFRHGGDAAIVPPVTDKVIPEWLRPVWTAAEASLTEARCWVVCGYSLPPYDRAMADLLQRAGSGAVERIVVLDPASDVLAPRFGALVPDAEVVALPGLPDGVGPLAQHLDGRM
jgi:hypothetical protein